MGSKRRISSAIVRFGHSRSSKVDDFGTNRKRVCDFLLVINSNYGPLLHRFWDAATYWLKIAYFSYPSLILRPFPYVPFGISRWSYDHEEESCMGLSSNEDRMIVAWVILTQCQRVTGGHTDRQTDFTIALHSKICWRAVNPVRIATTKAVWIAMFQLFHLAICTGRKL